MTSGKVIDLGQPPGDYRFPSSNEFDIPDLRADMAPVGLDAPLVAWGTRSRAAVFRGTWHFYVDDYRFAQIWAKPQMVTNTGTIGAVEPNFSVYEQTPFAVALWATYRKRWLARFWQERGVRVWVDLNVSDVHSELNLIGVPKGWRHFATRGYDEYIDSLKHDYQVARKHAKGEPILVVYGGGEKVTEAAKKMPGVIRVPEAVRARPWKKEREWAAKDQAARAASTA